MYIRIDRSIKTIYIHTYIHTYTYVHICSAQAPFLPLPGPEGEGAGSQLGGGVYASEREDFSVPSRIKSMYT